MISEITAVAYITTKQDMSRWTRAHADAPGITWSVFAGEGGTMIIVEHTEDRCSLNPADITPEAAAPAPSPAERNMGVERSSNVAERTTNKVRVSA